MATTGAVGGSQLDVQGLASQLVAAERARPEAQISRQTTQVTTQISALGQLMGSLSTFRSSLSSLKTVEAFSTRTAASSDDKTVAATATSKAVPGSYDIEVDRLAQAHQISSTPFVGGGTTVIGTGTLTVSLGGKSFNIDVTNDNSSLAKIRDAINSAEDNVGVRATLVQGTTGTRLMLSSSTTGAANTIQIAQSGGDGGLAQLEYSTSTPNGYTQIKEAQDARVFIAGTEALSSTNTISNVIEGVSITVKKETTPESGPVSLNIGYDNTAVTNKIKGFVTAYNALTAQVNKLRSYDAATQVAGPMLGDALLGSIESELRSALSSAVDGQPAGFQTLSSIGITTQADGTLGINEAKVQKALETNFEAVGKLFGSETGIAARMHAQVENRLKGDGALEARSKNLISQQKDIEKRKDDLDARMVIVRQNYIRQFTRLDTLLSQLQVTSSYMAQQIDSLPKANGG
jgi:flagellar hook-associated protein 2